MIIVHVSLGPAVMGCFMIYLLSLSLERIQPGSSGSGTDGIDRAMSG